MNGQRRKQIQDAFLDAFRTRAKLAQMLSFGLDWELDRISTAGNLTDTVFELLQYAESDHRLDDLIKAAQTALPNNTMLRELSVTRSPPEPSKTMAPPPPPPPPSPPRPLKLILSHATKDTARAKELKSALQPLVDAGLLDEPWREEDIPAGAVRNKVIEKQWSEADVIVLLLSADFLSTQQASLERARQLHAQLTIIPVLLRACGWSYTWLGKSGAVQLVPLRDGEVTAVSAFDDVAEAWQSVFQAVAQLTENPAP